MFDHHEEFDIDKAADNIPIFFYDKANTTFYATDEQITELLEALNKWYVKATKENEKYLKQQKKEKLEKQLKEIEDELKKPN